MRYLAANNAGVFRLRSEGFDVGMIFSPDGLRRPCRDGVWLPYAFDNGLYHKPGETPKAECEHAGVYWMLRRSWAEHWEPPMFAVVPDKPYDGAATLELWDLHEPMLRRLFPGVRLAMAVQDGMSVHSVIHRLRRHDWIFVAGSDEWKEAKVHDWVWAAGEAGASCHLARANETHRIMLAKHAECDSADGTGIWRGDKAQKSRVLRALVQQLMFPRQDGVPCPSQSTPAR